MRRVIGRDCSDGSVLEPFDQRGSIGRGSDRRIHLEIRIEGAQGFVGQAEMVRRHLRGRRYPFRARAPNRLHRLPGRQVEEVHRLPLVGGKREVALDHQAFRD